MGVLQNLFNTRCSSDVVVSYGSAWLSHSEWSKNVDENSASKSGPVTTIVLGKAEVDLVLNELGVIQRVGSSVADSVRVDHSIPINNIWKVPALDTTIHKQKIDLHPKDLIAEDLQDLAGEVEYQKIMKLYHFESVRYFREKIKDLGYRLLRGELWVVADKLWLLN